MVLQEALVSLLGPFTVSESVTVSSGAASCSQLVDRCYVNQSSHTPQYATAPVSCYLQVPANQQVPVQQTPPTQQVPVQQVPMQQVPMQQMPPQRVPVQQVPVHQVPVQQLPPPQQVPIQKIPVQQVPPQQVPIQQVPMQPVPIVQQVPVVKPVPLVQPKLEQISSSSNEHAAMNRNIQYVDRKATDAYSIAEHAHQMAEQLTEAERGNKEVVAKISHRLDGFARVDQSQQEQIDRITGLSVRVDSQVKDIAVHGKQNQNEIGILKAKVASLVEQLDRQNDPAEVRAKINDINARIESLAKRDEIQQGEIHGVSVKVGDLAEREAKIHGEFKERIQRLLECNLKQENQIKGLAGDERRSQDEIQLLKAKVASLVEHIESQGDQADVPMKIDEIMEQIERLAKRDEVQQTEIRGLADREAKLHNELNARVQRLFEWDQKQDNQIKDLASHEKKSQEEIEILKAKVESLVEHLEAQDDPTGMQMKVDDIMEQIEKLAKRDEVQQTEIHGLADSEAKLHNELNECVQ
ncbi:hypothetical protein GNI_080050, partial [Gregarina niphandrodes]